MSGVYTAVIVLAALLTLATGFMLARGRRHARAVQWGALAVLGFLDATYLAGPLNFGDSDNVAAYWAFLFVVAALIATACVAMGRRDPARPLVIALGFIVVMHVVDLVTGAHLELNTVFGYSATIGIRVSGQGNLTFAQLTAAVILLAGLLVWRRPGRRTVLLVIAMLAVTLFVMAAPPWGGDFGAALAGAPGFALLAWLLLGRRVRVRTLVLLGTLLVVSGLLVGIVDMLRPSSQQTHVGRFFNRVTEDGFGGFLLVIRRKAMENFGSFTTTRLVWLLPIGVAFLAYLWWTRSAHVRELVATTPVIAHTLVAFALTAVLGYALNDSGIAIPALMLLVLECAAAFLVAARLDEPNEPRPSTALIPEPALSPGARVYARSAERRSPDNQPGSATPAHQVARRAERWARGSGRRARRALLGDLVGDRLAVELVVERAELALGVGMTAEHALEPVVCLQREALERLVLEPGGAVLGAERVVGEPRGVEPHPRRERIHDGGRIGDTSSSNHIDGSCSVRKSRATPARSRHSTRRGTPCTSRSRDRRSRRH